MRGFLKYALCVLFLHVNVFTGAWVALHMWTHRDATLPNGAWEFCMAVVATTVIIGFILGHVVTKKTKLYMNRVLGRTQA